MAEELICVWEIGEQGETQTKGCWQSKVFGEEEDLRNSCLEGKGRKHEPGLGRRRKIYDLATAARCSYYHHHPQANCLVQVRVLGLGLGEMRPHYGV